MLAVCLGQLEPTSPALADVGLVLHLFDRLKSFQRRAMVKEAQVRERLVRVLAGIQ